MTTRMSLLLVGGLLMTHAAHTANAQHVHEGDLVVGQVDHRLTVEFDFGEPIRLSPVLANPFGLAGWSAEKPGFDHADGGDPDLNALAPGASLRLVGLSPFDTGLKARQPVLPFEVAIDATGGSLHLGDHELHEHAFWHLDSLDAAFEPLKTTWAATFKLVDLGPTAYLESEPFTLTFVTVPEPGSLLGWVIGVILMRCGRRA